jgi:hypothetical protein
MTSTYNRSQVYDFNDLSETQQQQVIDDYGFENSDCQSTSYVKLNDSFIPLSMFMRADSKFTHGIFSTSAFDGYFITFDRRNEYATIAHKHF